MSNIKSELILGAGNMVQALVPPYLNHARNRTSIYTPSGTRAQLFAKDNDISYLEALSKVDEVDILWLGMKPQQYRDGTRALKNSITANTLVISLLAGISTTEICDYLGVKRVIRIMPNTPALVNKGVNGIYTNIECTQKDEDFLAFIQAFRNVGKNYLFNREEEVDLITPFSGSGPAYFFEIARILSNKMTTLGFSKEISKEAIALTMSGAAEMLLQSNSSAEELRNNVTSKGGVTYEALKVLEESDLSAILERAIDQALLRNDQLKKGK